jgi:hypothetical protein
MSTTNPKRKKSNLKEYQGLMKHFAKENRRLSDQDALFTYGVIPDGTVFTHSAFSGIKRYFYADQDFCLKESLADYLDEVARTAEMVKVHDSKGKTLDVQAFVPEYCHDENFIDWLIRKDMVVELEPIRMEISEIPEDYGKFTVLSDDETLKARRYRRNE